MLTRDGFSLGNQEQTSTKEPTIFGHVDGPIIYIQSISLLYCPSLIQSERETPLSFNRIQESMDATAISGSRGRGLPSPCIHSSCPRTPNSAALVIQSMATQKPLPSASKTVSSRKVSFLPPFFFLISVQFFLIIKLCIPTLSI